MKRKSILALTLAAILATGLMGCAEQQVSMLIAGHYPGETNDSSTGCEFNTDFGGLVYGSGFINLGQIRGSGQPLFSGALARGTGESFTITPGAFYMTALIESKLQDSTSVGAESGGGGGGGFSGLTVNMSDVILEGARVEFAADRNTFNIEGFGTFTYEESFDRPIGFYVAPGGDVGALNIPIIANRNEATALRNIIRELVDDDTTLTFIAEIQVYGKTSSGHKVESNIFRWPITVCNDCNTASTPFCLPPSNLETAEEEEA